MRHRRTIPICSNTLFCYKLNIKEDLTLKFMNEEFVPRNLRFKAGKGADMNILNKYENLTKEIKEAVDELSLIHI